MRGVPSRQKEAPDAHRAIQADRYYAASRRTYLDRSLASRRDLCAKRRFEHRRRAGKWLRQKFVQCIGNVCCTPGQFKLATIAMRLSD